MRAFLRDESGAVGVMVAGLLVVFLGLVAIVLDAGYLYAEKRQLQSAADAAALAGAWRLGQGADAGALGDDPALGTVLGAVSDYAQKNAVSPGDGLAVLASPGTVVGSDYVKVTVEKDSPLYFANVFGMSHTPVRAQAVAQVEYLTGLNNPMPWALPILQVTHGTASLGKDGPPTTDLDDEGAGLWSGVLEPITVGGDIYVKLYNDQTYDQPDGMFELVGPIARAVERPPGSRIIGVDIEDIMMTAGGATRFTVTLASALTNNDKLSGGLGNNPPLLTRLTDTTYEGYIAAPDVGEAVVRYFPVRVELKNGPDSEVVDPAGYIVARRSTFPVKAVYASDAYFPSGSSASVDVGVLMNQYVPYTTYPLKVDGGNAEVGNFCRVDFSTLRHTPYWTKQDPAEYPSMPMHDAEGDKIENGLIEGTYDWPFVVHIGDTVWAQEGGAAGPTVSSLRARLQNDPWSGGTTYFDWVNSVPPKPYTRRLIYVPVTEKIDKIGNADKTKPSALRVVSFATFFLEGPPPQKNNDPVYGMFIEYTSAPGVVGGSPPPGQFNIKVPRLVKEHLDF